jgi:hypothetical protein
MLKSFSASILKDRWCISGGGKKKELQIATTHALYFKTNMTETHGIPVSLFLL